MQHNDNSILEKVPGAEKLLHSPCLKQIIDELNAHWQGEQQRRHDFWKDHPDNVKAEFVEGEILYHSPVKLRHQKVSQNLLKRLFQLDPSGMVGYEKMMVRCQRNDYEPDICFWDEATAQQFTPDQHIFPPPVFVAEILSESTEARDRGVKYTDYALHGVQEYWLVHPEENYIEQHLLNTRKQTFELHLKLKAGTLSSVAIPGFSVQVEAIF